LNANSVEVLLPHAELTGTVSELDAARKLPFQPKRTWPDRFAKWKSYVRSFRVSSERDQSNTILTAAQTLDAILGDGFGHALSGNVSLREAWAAAKRRSKAFQHQL
jgi:hypothetical protein